MIRGLLLMMAFAAAATAIGAHAAWRLTEPARAERLVFRAAAPVIDLDERIAELVEEIEGAESNGGSTASAVERDEWRELIEYGAERVLETLGLGGDEALAASVRRLIGEYDLAEAVGGSRPAATIDDLAELDWRRFTSFVLAESAEIVSAGTVTGIRDDAGEVQLDAVVERIAAAFEEEDGLDAVEAIPEAEIDLLGGTEDLLDALGRGAAAGEGEREELAEAAENLAEAARVAGDVHRGAGILRYAAAAAALALVGGLGWSGGWRWAGFGALAAAAAAGMLWAVAYGVERGAADRAADADDPAVESGLIVGRAAAEALLDVAPIALAVAAAASAASLGAGWAASRRRRRH